MHELVISSSLKTSPWGNHPVIWDFSSCLVDGAILWVFPEPAVVLPHLQPDVPLGIRLAPNSLPLELRPLPSMISSSWPQFSSRQPDRWKHLELPRKFSNTSAVPGGYWLSPHPHHVNCRAMLLNSVFVPVHGLSDLLKTQIFFFKNHSIPQSIWRLTIALTKILHEVSGAPNGLLQPHQPSFFLYKLLCSCQPQGLCTCCFL